MKKRPSIAKMLRTNHFIFLGNIVKALSLKGSSNLECQEIVAISLMKNVQLLLVLSISVFLYETMTCNLIFYTESPKSCNDS